MVQLHKLISTGLGIGYVGRGGGTVAAAATCLCWYFLPGGGGGLVLWQVGVTALITALGVWSANEVEPCWGKDDKKVVVDEAAGMCTSLLFIPVTVPYLLAGLVLFRFFDIVKPLGIRRTERLPGGWGVMMDDALSGIYANVVLQLLVYLDLF
ncbi:phosphatidylglycerophosphatase A family protein [Rufibacter quisquiliarum]|uniref:Phosphatidylglycerophosphatase A n=1 Tax=Rufibacter quisquiliarum TaxID=1549639 RepID=A0A839GBS1_9BACT|nr:phosphatidylglycerophosphatase A [Rufibacter quisquiliarum]MBA9076382.1 phosphatidylglycerophosphatase A [Rufibacter quisquiliarum]